MYCSHTPLKVNTSPKTKPSQKEFHHQTINYQVLFEGGYHISPMNSRLSRIIRRISIDRLDTCRALASCLRPSGKERAMKEGPLVGLGCIWAFPRIMVPPNHPFVHRVFHHFHHPFWGFYPYVWFNTHMEWQVPTQLWCTDETSLAWLLFCYVGSLYYPSMTNLNTALLREYSSKSLHICILWISPNE